MDIKLRHLELIQGVIARMANNSFSLKGWSVVIVAALFALAATDSDPVFIYLAYFPALMFWLLDGYFLWQERLFRNLYDAVRVQDPARLDFSMDTTPFATSDNTWTRACYSKTLLIFHGAIILSILLVSLGVT